MKIGEILIYICINIIMGSVLVYEFFFASEIDYSLISTAVKTILTSSFVIMCIFIRRKRLKQYGAILVKEAFQSDKTSHKKLIKAIDSFCSRKYKKTMRKLKKLEHKCMSNKDETVVKLFMAMCYHAEKKYEEAIAVYERMITTDGANAYAWAYLGRVYDEKKQRELAFQAYENAVRYQPDNAVVHCCLAYHYMEGLEIEKAYQSARKALEINGKRDDAAVIAALYWAFNGKEDLAMKFYRCYCGEKKLDKKLKTWIKDVCKNKSAPSPLYCENINEFQHLFWL